MPAISEKIRAEFSRGDAIRDAGLTTPADVVRYDNIPYGEHGRWQMLDVYRPKAVGNAKLPVIVSVHGGGWVYGDKEVYQFYCMNLAQRGFAVVNFTYRLAPEFKFPAPVEDTCLVFSWALKHAQEYGFHPESVFAVGDSAGAHTLALFCAICTNPEYAAQFSFCPPEGFVPKAIALNCGKYELLPGSLSDQDHDLMAEYLPHGGTAKELLAIHVISHITSNFPPVFLMTSTGDFLKQQAVLLARRLTDCDIPFLYRFYGDAQQKLGHVFHCDIQSPAAKKCNDEECAFFREYITP